MVLKLSAPTPIEEGHQLGEFSSGQDSLDHWLKNRALQNQRSGASRTYVVRDEHRVIAYYAVASGAITTGLATGKLKRNMPDPIPMVILARLAVDNSYQGQGLGRALFRDAALRILSASEAIGIRGLMVHAISDEAVLFYRALGLQNSSSEPNTMMISLEELRASL